MKTLRLSRDLPNWEVLTLALIRFILTPHGFRKSFQRTELMRQKNLDFLEMYTAELLKHKYNPQAMEQTLQSTLQTMRDKGYVTFLGAESYQLSPKGLQLLEKEEIRQVANQLTIGIRAPEGGYPPSS
jgi:hypothetical protein